LEGLIHGGAYFPNFTVLPTGAKREVMNTNAWDERFAKCRRELKVSNRKLYSKRTMKFFKGTKGMSFGLFICSQSFSLGAWVPRWLCPLDQTSDDSTKLKLMA